MQIENIVTRWAEDWDFLHSQVLFAGVADIQVWCHFFWADVSHLVSVWNTTLGLHRTSAEPQCFWINFIAAAEWWRVKQEATDLRSAVHQNSFWKMTEWRVTSLRNAVHDLSSMSLLCRFTQNHSLLVMSFTDALIKNPQFRKKLDWTHDVLSVTNTHTHLDVKVYTTVYSWVAHFLLFPLFICVLYLLILISCIYIFLMYPYCMLENCSVYVYYINPK